MGQITHPTLGSPMALVTPNGELVVSLFGQGVGPLEIDKSTLVLPTIDSIHQEIHEGDHFFLRNFITIGSGVGSTIFFGIDTPNGSKWIHFFYTLQSNGMMISKIWEGTTLSGGTTVNYFCNNRNSTNTGQIIIKSNPVISGAVPTSGTLISASAAGLATGQGAVSNRFGGVTQREEEIILKSGTTYLVEINSISNANTISYDATWYENTDKIKQW